jgi:hypothetical protein
MRELRANSDRDNPARFEVDWRDLQRPETDGLNSLGRIYKAKFFDADSNRLTSELLQPSSCPLPFLVRLLPEIARPSVES